LQARGEPGASTDSERGLEYARRIGDAQAIGPALSSHVRLLAREGERNRARLLLQEVIDLYAKNPNAPNAWLPPFVWAFAAVGEPGEYLALLEREARTPWVDAARAAGEQDFVTAAELYISIGAVSPAAEARVLAAEVLLERGDRAGSAQQLAEAIGFYRSVGATRLIQDAEKLLAATA
jgi:hypothetical protein